VARFAAPLAQGSFAATKRLEGALPPQPRPALQEGALLPQLRPGRWRRWRRAAATLASR